MDTKYKQIITSLNTNYTKSPNIITLWQVYLQIKKQRFIDDLDKCEQMLQQINQLNNVNSESLIALYIMQQYGFTYVFSSNYLNLMVLIN